MTGSEKSNARMLAGECFCGAVRYAVADAFAYALNCHCSNCRRTTGSAFKPVVRDGAFVHVAMGTLVDDPSIRPTAHIFVGSKAPWYVISDDLPQYQGHVVTKE